MRHEMRIVLESSIDQLPEAVRKAVRLRHLSGLSFREVAAQMDRTERAAQQLCTRGLRELRVKLASASMI